MHVKYAANINVTQMSMSPSNADSKLYKLNLLKTIFIQQIAVYNEMTHWYPHRHYLKTNSYG